MIKGYSVFSRYTCNVSLHGVHCKIIFYDNSNIIWEKSTHTLLWLRCLIRCLYRCKWGIAISEIRFIWIYVYSPFKILELKMCWKGWDDTQSNGGRGYFFSNTLLFNLIFRHMILVLKEKRPFYIIIIHWYS